MSRVGEECAYWTLRLMQFTPFRGNRNEFSRAAAGNDQPRQIADFSQAILEAENCTEFLRFFADCPLDVSNATVLDLGSGYGGKTVEMARRLKVARMVGIEPYEKMVEKSRAYANAAGAEGVEFRICGDQSIPADDEEFDAIVSRDVIEHVADPTATLAEMSRVLKDGGAAYTVFTPYWGALSHHLGYVTRLPGIHWVFSAKVLIGAVNRILAGPGGKRFGTAVQPLPKRSFDGRMDVLPALNGVGGREFLELARKYGFEVKHARYPTIVERFKPGWTALKSSNAWAMSLHPRLAEALSYNLVCILQKGSKVDLSRS